MFVSTVTLDSTELFYTCNTLSGTVAILLMVESKIKEKIII